MLRTHVTVCKFLVSLSCETMRLIEIKKENVLHGVLYNISAVMKPPAALFRLKSIVVNCKRFACFRVAVYLLYLLAASSLIYKGVRIVCCKTMFVLIILQKRIKYLCELVVALYCKQSRENKTSRIIAVINYDQLF